MEIGILFNCAPQFFKYQNIVSLIESELKAYLYDRNYGSDVLEIYIGIICVSPEMSSFFEPMKPKYNKERKIYYKDGVKYELFRTFQYEFEISFDKLALSKESQVKTILVKELINSLSILDKLLPRTVKDFNIELFKLDIIAFLLNYCHHS
jgi:hypothetical protein